MTCVRLSPAAVRPGRPGRRWRNACRTFGVHRSTYYAWRRQVDRQGLEMLRPRERRRPVMPNQLSPIVQQRIVAFALGHPGLGPKRISAQLARPEWGALL